MTYCHNCNRYFMSMGIARHRAMHRDRKELVTITLKSGTWEYDYRDPEGNLEP